MLHGWALDRRAWDKQRALADRFRLILPDRRGFGRSTAPPDAAAETADLVAILDLLGVERAIAVGMSQGGRTALQLALAHPERVAGLVLQGAPLDGFLPGPRGADAIPLAAYRKLVLEGRIEEMRRLWRNHPLMRGAGADALIADYDGRDLKAPEGPAGPLAGALGEIEAPALVVTGQEDIEWRQLVGDALAYGLPNGRRARLPGGHLCNLSNAEAYNAMLAAFAARLAA